MKRLLVRVPNWLGDLVMSLEALAGLASRYPRIAFWSHERVSGLLPVFFPGIPVIVSPGKPVRGEHDTLLLMTDSFRSAMEGLLARIPERMGHSTQMRRTLLTRAIAPLKGRGHHHSLDYARLCRMADAEPARIPGPSIPAAGAPHVAIFPGAAYGPAKRWPRYPELAGVLSDELGVPVRFYGAGTERSMLERLSAVAPGTTAVTGLGLAELSSELLGAVLAVGNDSGGIHLAAALGIPTVAVFGSTSPEWTSPRGPFTGSVTSGLSCSPCFRRTCASDPAACLAGVGVDRVAEACRALLSRSAGAR